jgi:hypothetical protein
MQSALGPKGTRAVGALVDRWNSFVGKLNGRCQEILAEADAGMAQIIAMDPTNSGAISAATTGVGSRLQALGSKVSEAEEKLSSEWDEAVDDADLEDGELDAANAAWTALVEESRALQRDLDRKKELFEIASGATWARTLFPLAQAEVARPRQCSQCGAAIAPTIAYAACNVACSHCGAVSSLEVGPATGLYYEGGVHHLAREHARDAWLAQNDAEHWLHDLREPTDADQARFLAAAQTYWHTYYTAFAHFHPGMNRSIDEAVAAKMAHYHHRW